jgi:putative ABC transport system permease protein
MVSLALRELISRRTATLLAGTGLLTATLGFMILASTSLTTQATLRGDINRAWAAPYDLLVRPPGSPAPLEARDGLVRPNFLSGGSGGITMQQLEAIRQIPGVDVAAPIAILGYVYWPATTPVELSAAVQSDQELQVYRLHLTATADAGMSKIPFSDRYELVAPHGTVHYSGGPNPATMRTTLTFPGGNVDCTPFDPQVVDCWAPNIDCPLCRGIRKGLGTAGGGGPGWLEQLPQPLLVAAIDPEAEARLTGLSRCVSQGNYLKSGPLQFHARPSQGPGPTVPVVDIPSLVSTMSFVDETYALEIDKSLQPTPLQNGSPPGNLTSWSQVSTSDVSAQSIYDTALGQRSPVGGATLFVRPGDVQYSEVGSDHLAANLESPDFSVYQDAVLAMAVSQQAPPEAFDVWFRRLTQADWNNSYPSNYHMAQAAWLPSGSYDPTCLPDFSDLGAGQLTTYAPPEVSLPNGKKLLPTRSAAGYVNTPPLLLTTLEAAQFFSDPVQYPGGLGNKFITAVRIRVTGVDIPGPVSRARLTRVAAAIRDATGLAVDVIRGSSPRNIQVDLPAGKFGRPALTVTEPWAVKGVTFTFLRAVSAQNLALFALVLVGAIVLVGETSYISAVRRRREFGVLRALGWRTFSIAWLVELEMLVLGLVAGVVALIIGEPVVLRLGLANSAGQLAAVVPLAIVVAGLAGIVPAFAAARGSTMAMIQSIGGAGITNRRAPNGLFGLAWRELRGQWRVEAVISAFAIALGASTLGVLVLVAAAFRGQLDTTVLGTYLSGEVRPFHLVLAGLTVAVGAIAAAEVVTLSYLERRAHLGALRALGWPASAVVTFLVAQAGVVSITGGIAAAIAVIVAGLLLRVQVDAIGWGLLAATGMSIVSTLIAALAPIAHAYRANPADALRGE